MIGGTAVYIQTINKLKETYIRDTREVIRIKEEIETANAWERLPANQQKEILRHKYNEIVLYYSVEVPENQKLSSKQVLETFNVLFDCTKNSKSVNFFLPVAYMKVMTNFNPNHDREWKYGISAFYIKQGEALSNLPLVKGNENFNVAYKGRITLQNPSEAIKLLVARIDDLMTTFNNREDWVVLSLLRNEYDIIDKYWEDGKGAIPDSFYREGEMAEILRYFNAFRNFRLIPVEG